MRLLLQGCLSFGLGCMAVAELPIIPVAANLLTLALFNRCGVRVRLGAKLGPLSRVQLKLGRLVIRLELYAAVNLHLRRQSLLNPRFGSLDGLWV